MVAIAITLALNRPAWLYLAASEYPSISAAARSVMSGAAQMDKPN
jgi:hypothetical protein